MRLTSSACRPWLTKSISATLNRSVRRSGAGSVSCTSSVGTAANAGVPAQSARTSAHEANRARATMSCGSRRTRKPLPSATNNATTPRKNGVGISADTFHISALRNMKMLNNSSVGIVRPTTTATLRICAAMTRSDHSAIGRTA